MKGVTHDKCDKQWLWHTGHVWQNDKYDKSEKCDKCGKADKCDKYEKFDKCDKQDKCDKHDKGWPPWQSVIIRQSVTNVTVWQTWQIV